MSPEISSEKWAQLGFFFFFFKVSMFSITHYVEDLAPERGAAEVADSPSSPPSPALALIIVLRTVLVCHWRPVSRRVQPRLDDGECEAFCSASVCSACVCVYVCECVCARIDGWRKENGLSRGAGRNVGQGYFYQGNMLGKTAE